ncbi:putative DNA-binding domain-containing protein [Maricaulis maris]|uniref:HvfC/BufC family peptide modification chaperone n=1 Tax=Maricaulis maris TaxID=74318 RepID=UPI003B8D5926
MSRQFYDGFADLVNGAASEPMALRLERPGQAGRLAVYRNNVASAAIEALRAAYPVVNAVTGSRFFSPMAKAFWRRCPPRTRGLSGYGDGFANHVAGYQPARMLPYLADIARLDRAWIEAHHAADGHVCRPAQVAALSPASLAELTPGLHPSARLLDLSWPIHDIWQRHRSGQSIERDLRLAAEAQSVLVWRPYGDVRSVVLDPGSACFLASLNEGKALASASEHTLVRYPDFDPAAAFGAALSAGYLSGALLP